MARTLRSRSRLRWLASEFSASAQSARDLPDNSYQPMTTMSFCATSVETEWNLSLKVSAIAPRSTAAHLIHRSMSMSWCSLDRHGHRRISLNNLFVGGFMSSARLMTSLMFVRFLLLIVMLANARCML